MSLFKLVKKGRFQSLITTSLRGVVLFCALSFLPSLLLAEAIVAVKSVDIRPYKRAIKGFKEVLPNQQVDEYVLRYKGSNGEVQEKVLLMVNAGETDLLFTLGSEALDLVKDSFSDVPVIFSFVLNPNQVIGGEWVKNPNFSGISMNIPPVEQFKILQQAVPTAKRIGVVYDPLKTGDQVAQALKSAQKLGMQIVPQEINSSEEAIDAIDRLEGNVDAIWMVPDTTAITREAMKYILLFSFRNGLPLIGLSEKYVKSGALFALSFDSEDIGRQAGEMAEKILDGHSVESVGIHSPRLLKLSINIKTAKKIGLNVPDKLVQMADKIY